MKKQRILLLGAAGRDFHNFNTFFRNNEQYHVVAFTATQIPEIEDRRYPPELAGRLYPDGIPVFSENHLEELIPKFEVDVCVFSYSDVTHQHVMEIASRVNTAGAYFLLLGPAQTMLNSIKPVISVCAVRTGSGKSQTSRYIIQLLMNKGYKVVAIRHPMPYGDLVKQRVQRFATIKDLEQQHCTIEEMEEYEPHVSRGNVIYSGVDYEAILRAAENDPLGCDVILWDGGNNDFSFLKPDLSIVVTDPHRVGAELTYYPSQIVLRAGNVIIINKTDTASKMQVTELEKNIAAINPGALVIHAESPVWVENPEVITGKRVLCVEDGPTLTHGEMKFGAAVVAAKKYNAAKIIDPRPYIAGKLKHTYKQYPDIGTILPAMGYGIDQVKDLERTINRVDCDSVIIGTPVDLSRIIKINKPFSRVYYDLKETGSPNMVEVLAAFEKKYLKKEAASSPDKKFIKL